MINLVTPSTVEDKLIQFQNDDDFYKTRAENWFIARPYGFRITLSDNRSSTIFLPISPSNLTISTNFATNMVPTLYGTVEEHSDVRYFDITIEGTTGMVPKYTAPYINTSFSQRENDRQKQEAEVAKITQPGRASFAVNKTIPLGGFFSKTLGALNQIKNQALNVIDGSQKPNEPGFDNTQTGYVAFHNLYKMLLRYKRDASGGGGLLAQASALLNVERKIHPIVFFNYKDNNQYNVVIRNFVMRRSADNPMLYYYSITMRGYTLRGLSSKVEIDQSKVLSDLGLDGVDGSSILGSIKTRANAAKGVIGAAVGGINILGR